MHNCPDQLKGPSGIKGALLELQQKYNKIIKCFDTDIPGKVSVTYWMVKLPTGQQSSDKKQLDWTDVRTLVERKLPEKIELKLSLKNRIKNSGIEEKV